MMSLAPTARRGVRRTTAANVSRGFWGQLAIRCPLRGAVTFRYRRKFHYFVPGPNQ